MILDILKTLRPKQWSKNFFIFAALVFDRQLTNIGSFFTTLFCFLIFCLLSSTVYIFNDLFDIEADSIHPVKKNRPIASGRINIKTAVATGLLFGAIALFTAFRLSFSFYLICLTYLAINLLYSKWMKHFPIIDVLIVASGFVLRVAAGVTLIEVE